MLTSIGDRIRLKRKELKLTQQELARKMQGVSHVAISQWESNTTKPNAENLYELSLLLGCDFAWLLKGEGSNVATVVNLDKQQVPILSIEDILEWNGTHPIGIKKEGEFIMTNYKISELAFALRIIGDSMNPEFIEGDIVIIDPTIKPKPGEFVLAKTANEIFFRKFRLDQISSTEGVPFMLSPMNEDYTSVYSSHQDITILGTMIEHRIYRRKR